MAQGQRQNLRRLQRPKKRGQQRAEGAGQRHRYVRGRWKNQRQRQVQVQAQAQGIVGHALEAEE